MGSSASERAWSAPATISSGARSPPIASTATRTALMGPLGSREVEDLDLAAAVRAAGRADAVRELRLVALRAGDEARCRDLVRGAPLVAAGFRLFPLGNGH